MRMVSIASGSSGNCIYIGSDNTHVLVDAGISNKRIEMGLNDLGLNARELDGILITHEHSDHIKGLGVLARKYVQHKRDIRGNSGFQESWRDSGRSDAPDYAGC